MNAKLEPEAVFEELRGRGFETARSLEESFVEVFNRHLEAFPPHYSYRQLIAWGREHDMILKDDAGTFWVLEVKHSPRRFWPFHR